MAASGSWFRGSPAALQQALRRPGVVRHCANRQRLFARGHAPDGLYCVASGAVRVAGVREEGDGPVDKHRPLAFASGHGVAQPSM